MKTYVTKNGKEYGVGFNFGVQYFELGYRGTKKEAEWMQSMLKKCFSNFKKSIVKKELLK